MDADSCNCSSQSNQYHRIISFDTDQSEYSNDTHSTSSAMSRQSSAGKSLDKSLRMHTQNIFDVASV